MRTGVVLSCVIGITIAGDRLAAHHSVPAMYDTRREIRIAGAIVQVGFVNPHPFLIVDVRGSDGIERWTLEMDNRSELTEAGFTPTTLRPGDQVSIAGNPAWREARHMYIMRLDRPADGFAYQQVDNRPVIRARAK